VITVAAA